MRGVKRNPKKEEEVRTIKKGKKRADGNKKQEEEALGKKEYNQIKKPQSNPDLPRANSVSEAPIYKREIVSLNEMIGFNIKSKENRNKNRNKNIDKIVINESGNLESETKNVKNLSRQGFVFAEPEENELGIDREEEKYQLIHEHLLEIFKNWINQVLIDEKYLFSEEEIQLYNKFLNLKEISQYLLLRIYLRKDGWIKIETLKKYCLEAKSPEYETAMKELTDNNFLINFSSNAPPLEGLLKLLTIPQLKELLKGEKWFKSSGVKTKEAFISKILDYCKTQPNLFNLSNWALSSKKGSSTNSEKYIKKCLVLLGERTRMNSDVRMYFDRLQLVYHRTLPLNQHHLTQAILVQRNSICYPNYNINRNKNLFINREYFLFYEKASILYHTTLEAFELRSKGEEYLELIKDISDGCYNDWQQQIAFYENYPCKEYQLSFTPGHSFTKIQEMKLKVLALNKEYKKECILLYELLKQTVFRQSKRGEWYCRLALILNRYMKKYPDSLREGFTICKKALEDPLLYLDDKEMIYDRLKKIKNSDTQFEFKIPEFEPFSKINLIAQKIHANCIDANSRRIYRSTDGSESTVEEISLDHFKRLGYFGYHCEGGLIFTLFAYLFWDILFTSLDGVLETKFLSHPQDLMSKDFYLDRKDSIETLIKKIELGEGETILTKVYNEQNKRPCRVIGLDWSYSIIDLTSMVNYLPNKGLANILKRIAMNYKYCRSGFPDLTLINPEKREVRFAEVKGPGDSLSFKQKTWLRELKSNGIQADVVLLKNVYEEEYLDHSDDN